MKRIYRMAPWSARAKGHRFDVTLVTSGHHGISTILTMYSMLRALNPRRSLAAAVGWLVLVMSMSLVLLASLWVGDTVRVSLIDQRVRQLDSVANRITAELNLNLALRLQSMRVLAALLGTELRDENRAAIRKTLANLQQASPEFEWITVADSEGNVLGSTRGAAEHASVVDYPWFRHGLQSPTIDNPVVVPMSGPTPSGTRHAAPEASARLGAAVLNAQGETVGVVGTQLSTRWLPELARSLAVGQRGEAGVESLLLDRNDTVLIGPADLMGTAWTDSVKSSDAIPSSGALNASTGSAALHSAIARSMDSGDYLVAQATLTTSDAWHALGWHVVVRQPLQDAMRRANILQTKITAILIGLGLGASLIGVLITRRLTRSLDAITRSADKVRSGASQQIEVPHGQDEAALLGGALAELLDSLQRERRALLTLNAELDQRVAARTREIERLADETRYAAVVRERLRIARELHDTLAHSMMAMLTEIRLLKRLAAVEPGALEEEFGRAEEAAHQGLTEVRAAIAQIRFNPVRDAGLAAALDDFVKLFAERTCMAVEFMCNAPTGAFANAEGETLFRIVEEAMRNIERHSGATQVKIALRVAQEGSHTTLTIADNGVGFDVDAPHPGHYGLSGLHEQAQLIGALLAIHSVEQQGTTIQVEVSHGFNP